ncbi:type IV toxin-antitoxin system AbiEi family antitoxin domain-containing protein [Oxalobacteraceae bacterium]|nr:type IV toxin-antitoxin system AbiEi family antitoxin domain-containing protein [Oxalobacteraceae bacterium]
MPNRPHIERVLALVQMKGLLRPSDLLEIGVPRILLTRMTASGHLEKTGRGLYRLPGTMGDENDTLAAVATRAPQAIFCLLSALQFHELGTQLPRKIWIAMPRGSHLPRIKYPPLTMVQYSGEAYSSGIEIHERNQTPLRVYNVAKTIADCFKHRNVIGLDVAIEALKEALAQSKLDVNELWRYATICRVTNVMRPYLEALQ